jgi:TonB dependent receptor-like, beta-barrel/Carboxypeptidase regulatory-like domain/TonB-dependent Receptor Plug Domain
MARALAGMALCLVLLFPAAAQTTGKIAGTVIDIATGDPLPGVNVFIASTLQGTTTNLDGYFFILNVRPGTYAVGASFIGFATVSIQNVRVRIDKTTELDINLREEIIEGEELIIVAERPLVQRDLTSSSTSISAEELASLPVLNFTDVINLQAGIVEGHFRGGRVGEVSYMVDGVPINDVFDQTFAFQIENNAIQEVEIISGTFNAEFGQAQSGVVNIVTKDGDQQYRGSFSAYLGDYLTSDTGLFQRLDRVSPTDSYEVLGSFSGPVPGTRDRVTFFTSGRRVTNKGYLFGQRIVDPAGTNATTARLIDIDGRQVFVPALGDSSFSSMNRSEQLTGQFKLTARLFGQNKLSANLLLQRDEGKDYDHLFRFNPGGIPTTFGDSRSLTTTYTQLFGTTSFLDVKVAIFRNEVRSYVYKDPLDPRYPNDNALAQLGGNFSFFRGGARMRHFQRQTETLVGRLDFTSQASKRHMIKTGIELKRHKLFLNEFEVKNNSGTNFLPEIPPSGTPDNVLYNERPIEASAYIQDKMEFDFMVVNAGVRLDYFDANSEVLDDFGRPRTSPRSPSRAKWQISPRFGLAYPLSERGVVHIAYGHFFQMPPFQFLFTNPDYIFDPEEGLNRAFGYPDLEPQRSVAYEIGLQQAFSDVIGVEMTVYFKDIRNLLGTRLEVIKPGFDEAFQLERYGRFVNRDYGQVKGFILAFERRLSDGFGLQIDYTFQVAQGNASDPRSALLDEQAGIEPEKQLVPLDWDRRHQLNTTLTLGTPGNWIATLVGRLGTGLPYTPSLADERIGVENSGRRRGTVTFDLFASKNLSIRGADVSLFARVFNLLDRRNEIQVYTDTGRAFPNLQFLPGDPQGLNTKDEFLERPNFFSPPRQVTVGLSFSF